MSEGGFYGPDQAHIHLTAFGDLAEAAATPPAGWVVILARAA